MRELAALIKCFEITKDVIFEENKDGKKLENLATSVNTTGVETTSDESAWLDTSCFNFDSEEDESPF